MNARLRQLEVGVFTVDPDDHVRGPQDSIHAQVLESFDALQRRFDAFACGKGEWTMKRYSPTIQWPSLTDGWSKAHAGCTSLTSTAPLPVMSTP